MKITPYTIVNSFSMIPIITFQWDVGEFSLDMGWGRWFIYLELDNRREKKLDFLVNQAQELNLGWEDKEDEKYTKLKVIEELENYINDVYENGNLSDDQFGRLLKIQENRIKALRKNGE